MASIGTSQPRVEDRRLLTGAGEFVGDLDLDELQRVLDRCRGRTDDGDVRLADEAHDAIGEQRARHRVGHEPRDRRQPTERQVVVGDDVDDTGRAARR